MKIIGYLAIILASIWHTNNAKCKWKTAVYNALLVSGCAMAWIA